MAPARICGGTVNLDGADLALLDQVLHEACLRCADLAQLEDHKRNPNFDSIKAHHARRDRINNLRKKFENATPAATPLPAVAGSIHATPAQPAAPTRERNKAKTRSVGRSRGR